MSLMDQTAAPDAPATTCQPGSAGSTRRPVARVGHKGAGHLAPGNTVESFDAAAACGVDAIEFDVARRRGRLVLAHSSWDARRRCCITLDDGLAHLAGETFAGMRFNVDIKRPGYERAVLAALHRYGLAERSLICSQYRRVLARVRAADPDMRVGLSVGGFWSRRYHRWPVGRALTRAASLLADGRCHALMAHHSLIGDELLALVRQAGGELYAWTVDCPTRIAALSELGVTGVTTNDPRLFG